MNPVDSLGKPFRTVVWINGSFGVGKTTVAKLLQRKILTAKIYDPEPWGFLTQRAARLVGQRIGDFQTQALWRRGTILGIRLMGLRSRVLLVPMTVSDPAIRGGFSSSVPDSRPRDNSRTPRKAPSEAARRRRGVGRSARQRMRRVFSGSRVWAARSHREFFCGRCDLTDPRNPPHPSGWRGQHSRRLRSTTCGRIQTGRIEGCIASQETVESFGLAGA